jgi:hypothetical protein
MLAGVQQNHLNIIGMEGGELCREVCVGELLIMREYLGSESGAAVYCKSQHSLGFFSSSWYFVESWSQSSESVAGRQGTGFWRWVERSWVGVNRNHLYNAEVEGGELEGGKGHGSCINKSCWMCYGLEDGRQVKPGAGSSGFW